jgi:hypothetical protein
MDPVAIADGYFAAIRNRDIAGLAALFQENAVMTLPDGRQLNGLSEIKGMYQYLFSASSPVPSPTAAIVGTNGIATEIEARLEDGTVRRTANFFHLGSSGLIERLSTYRRDA